MSEAKYISSTIAGRLKARDIIPGWPRGRSSVPPARKTLARRYLLSSAWAFLCSGQATFDKRFMEDVEAERAEERRKADMMEGLYRSRRIEAGIFEPDPFHITAFYPMLRMLE